MPVFGTLTSSLHDRASRQRLSQGLLTRGVSACVGLGTLFCGTSASFADVQPSLSTFSILEPLGNCSTAVGCTIRGGYRQDDNLFHGFDKFAIPPSGNVTLGTPAFVPFIGTSIPSDVERIFIRVVDSITEIEGRFSVDGAFTNSPDIMFLSPQGIRIGDNARLDYPGNFLFSTAERLDFGNGAIFDATDNITPLFFTISGLGNLPIALELGNSPGGIEFSNSVEIPKTQHQFSIIGGAVNFDNIDISTPGDLYIASVDNNQTVGLTFLGSSLDFNYGTTPSFKTIHLTNSTLSSGSFSSLENAGSLQLVGQDLRLNQSSLSTLTNVEGGDISLDFTELVNLGAASEISSGANTASAVAGEISIHSDELRLEQSSLINSSTTTNGGDINLNVAGQVELEGQSQILTQAVGSTDSAGNITISAGSLRLLERDKIETSSNSTDGNINLTITDNVLVEYSSQISTASSAPTTSGSNITLDASGQVLLQNQGSISTQPGTSTANFGEISISSGSLDLTNQSAISTISGEVSIDSGQIQLRQSSQINSSTDTTGGDINLTSSGQVELNTQSKITTQATAPNASAGNINLTAAGSLLLLEENQIETSSNAANGDINLTISGDFLVENFSRISTASSSTATSDSNITLNANRRNITLRDHSIISTQPNTSTAGFGNISIDSDWLNVNNQSDISTTAGEISIHSISKTRLVQNSSITSSTPTAGGNIAIEVDNGSIELDNQSKIATETTASTADSGDITLTSEGLDLLNQSQISTSTGSGGRGDINLNMTAGVTLDNQSQIFTETTASPADAGNIVLASTSLDLRNQSQVSTRTSSTGGGITLFVIGDAQVSSSNISTAAQNNSAIAGNISLSADSLNVQNSGKVTSGSNGFTSGDIVITLGNNLNILDNGEVSTVANSPSTPITSASAGNIAISGIGLTLQEAGKLYSLTGDSGGDITLTFTGDISLSNTISNPENSIATRAVGTGNAGTLSLNSHNLSLSDQSQILSETGQGGGDLSFSLSGDLTLNTGGAIQSVATEGSGGSAGNITIIGGNTLTIDGANSSGPSSQISSLTEFNGGDISLDFSGGNVTLSEGAQLKTSLTANGNTIQGDAGNLNLQAQDLSLSQNSSVLTETAGGKGNIGLDLSGQLSVIDGSSVASKISSASATMGAAGTITIDANSVFFAQGNLQSETGQPGGDINVTATNTIEFVQGQVRLSSGSGEGHTGNLSLTSQASAPTVGILFVESEVSNEATNTGGNVTLTTPGVVELQDGSFISIDSSGRDGNFSVSASAFRSNAVDADNDVLLNQGSVGNLSLLADISGFDVLASQVERSNGNSELLPSPFPMLPPEPPESPPSMPPPVTSIPPVTNPSPSAPAASPSENSPTVTPSSPTPTETVTNQDAPASQDQSSVELQPMEFFSQPANLTTLTYIWQFYGDASSNQPTPWSCSAAGESRLRFSGRGGLGSTPFSLGSGNSSLADLGRLAGSTTASSLANSSQLATQPPGLSPQWLEAQTWRRDHQGNIQLMAQSKLASTATPQDRCQSLH